ncbi:crotonase/enoyl-CoA hydratase family protein [Thermogemmatispora sp.]|uniref:crotonase/enoyl-CoA hydratase family protein n=1 Tax=Thermogemmatispora sp. TaxID=1968838 RepID=UPI001DDD6B49|nr:crotonase/enoyl-CoA hydratase family protein [Thermogemmatispora sp.]MBX5449594.1 crotonase/enoyl-CoA hydratase family protein [Thermogemmatispora sp.]
MSERAESAAREQPGGARPLLVEPEGAILVVTLNRPERRNAISSELAAALLETFRRFDADPTLSVAVLTGSGGCFCSGFDLKELAAGQMPKLDSDGSGPLGPTRLLLQKPVIAAIEGYAVAGGLELALWCDLRVAAEDAVFGVYNRRWGIPLIDGGTVRLPRLIGQSQALDLILTGRSVSGEEAWRMGLVNRLTPHGEALPTALTLARQLASFPQQCLRSDRLSVYEQWSLPLPEALHLEASYGLKTLQTDEAKSGARRFAEGHGRHGRFDDF